MFVVDTNVLLQAASKEFPNHKQIKTLLEAFRNRTLLWHSTWGIFYEFLRVSTHHAVFEKPLSARQAWDFLKNIFTSPSFSMLTETKNHDAIVESLIHQEPKGNLWHDAHTVALMMENGIQDIYTFDTDFHRFKTVRVMSPV